MKNNSSLHYLPDKVYLAFDFDLIKQALSKDFKIQNFDNFIIIEMPNYEIYISAIAVISIAYHKDTTENIFKLINIVKCEFKKQVKSLTWTEEKN